ncbi:MAG: YidH family protein [Pyrinomonadaceae bacterium]
MAAETQLHAVPHESHAQELLASERTFLSWIRTSIAILSVGFAIIKLSAATSLGMIMVGIAGAMSAIGAFHYRRTNKNILEGKVESSNWLVLSVSATVVLLSIAVIIYLAAEPASK